MRAAASLRHRGSRHVVFEDHRMGKVAHFANDEADAHSQLQAQSQTKMLAFPSMAEQLEPSKGVSPARALVNSVTASISNNLLGCVILSAVFMFSLIEIYFFNKTEAVEKCLRELLLHCNVSALPTLQCDGSTLPDEHCVSFVKLT